MIPYDTMDITRYYEMFEDFKNLPFRDIFEKVRNVDYFFSIYSWAILKIGLPKEFIPFNVTLITYSLYFLSFCNIIKHFTESSYTDKRNKLLTLLGFFLLINEIKFMDAANGLRNALAFSLFTYTISKYIIQKYTIGCILIGLLAITIHASAILIFIPFVIANISNPNRVIFTKFLIYLSFILLIIGSENIFYKLIEFLTPTLENYNLYYPSYFSPEGVWGAGYYENANLNTLIFEKYLKPLPYYISGFYFIFVKRFYDNRMAKFLIILFFLVSLLSISRTIFDRLNNIFVILFTLFLIIELIHKKITLFKKLFLVTLTTSVLLVSLGATYKYRDIYAVSWLKMTYTPVPLLFNNEIKQEDYIIRHSGE